MRPCHPELAPLRRRSRSRLMTGPSLRMTIFMAVRRLTAAELPMKKVTRRALRGHFHSPVVPAGHGNLRRIRNFGRRTRSWIDPSVAVPCAKRACERSARVPPSHENVGIAAGAGPFMAAGGSWDPWIPQDDTRVGREIQVANGWTVH